LLGCLVEARLIRHVITASRRQRVIRTRALRSRGELAEIAPPRRQPTLAR
jgi:hypothetical protein